MLINISISKYLILKFEIIVIIYTNACIVIDNNSFKLFLYVVYLSK